MFNSFKNFKQDLSTKINKNRNISEDESDYSNCNKHSEAIAYHRTDNRELKLAKINHAIQQEIGLAIEHRRSNQLVNHRDHIKDIFARGYKLKECLGSGSYAHVFRAKDITLNREVAIKLIELDKCSKHYKEVCLRNEIYVIRKLSHENIVRFYEGFNTRLAYVMVMELIENGTFADYLRQNGPVNSDKARQLFHGVFYGIDYMHNHINDTNHNHSIAHRDLKLENLLLTKNFVPKIVDFSLSVIWDGEKLLSDWCGTPPYFPPEILLKKPYNPLCCDIWSLGVCLFVMLNDTIPFSCTNDQIQLQKQLNHEWKFRTKYERFISNDLKQVIQSMLEPNMNLRIKISELLATKWFKNIKTR